MARLSAARNLARKKSHSDTDQRPLGSAREVLLQSARKLFARKGLSGTSIRDIATEAGMNSSQISYYFDGKEGLYRACVADIAMARLRIAEQILLKPSSQEEFKVRLRLFVENIFNHFLEDADAGLIIIREYDRVHSPAAKEFKNGFIKLLDLIQDYFAVGIKKGFISKRRDAFVLMSLFFGTIMNELRFDHIKAEIYSRSLKRPAEKSLVIDHIVDLFASA